MLCLSIGCTSKVTETQSTSKQAAENVEPKKHVEPAQTIKGEAHMHALIIAFKPSKDAQSILTERLKRELKLSELKLEPLYDQTYTTTIQSDKSMSELIKVLNGLDFIDYAEANQEVGILNK